MHAKSYLPLLASLVFTPVAMLSSQALAESPSAIDGQLQVALRRAGFSGTVGSSIERRLGRPIDKSLANLGRLIWFDKFGGLHDDNTCGGCHSPAHGFGDSQSIAIGVQNNNRVGDQRRGPRN